MITSISHPIRFETAAVAAQWSPVRKLTTTFGYEHFTLQIARAAFNMQG
jgi:hypothetical protein